MVVVLLSSRGRMIVTCAQSLPRIVLSEKLVVTTVVTGGGGGGGGAEVAPVGVTVAEVVDRIVLMVEPEPSVVVVVMDEVTTMVENVSQ